MPRRWRPGRLYGWQMGPRPEMPHPEVVLLCGVAGSGKTTYAKQLESLGYTRLSIDEYIWQYAGQYGIDYEPQEYERLQVEAENALRDRLVNLVAAGRRVVVDFSFWRRARRDRYKALVQDAGGTRRLIYLKADPDEVRRRLKERATRFDANAAFPITEQMLEQYLAGFEEPVDEGEEVIHQPPFGPA